MNNPGPGRATVCVTNPCVKPVILTLDAVFDLAGAPLALAPHRDRDIEDQREIRLEPPRGDPQGGFDIRPRQPPSRNLIRDGGQPNTVGDDDLAICERGPYDPLHQLSSGCQ